MLTLTVVLWDSRFMNPGSSLFFRSLHLRAASAFIARASVDRTRFGIMAVKLEDDLMKIFKIGVIVQD